MKGKTQKTGKEEETRKREKAEKKERAEKTEKAEKTEETTRERILEETIAQFNEKGLKFTMDDIARNLSISKKTIYAIIGDKKTLLNEMADYCFDSIREKKEEIFKSSRQDTVCLIKEVLKAMPQQYQNIDLRQLHVLKDKYPPVYAKVAKRLESDWDTTLTLLNRGVKEGVIREFNVAVFKTMMHATLEKFFEKDILVENDITYQEALEEVVEILIDGVRIQKTDSRITNL